MIFNAKEMETVLETLPYQHHPQFPHLKKININ